MIVASFERAASIIHIAVATRLVVEYHKEKMEKKNSLQGLRVSCDERGCSFCLERRRRMDDSF